MEPLFPEPSESRTSPLGWVEPHVHWFTESTRPEAVASREVVNEWYSDFPDPDGKFAERLRSEVDVDHLQALDELHVHHLLRTRHTDVRYEEGGVGPDFRVYEDGVCVGAVEVASLFQEAEWTKEEMQHHRLADEVNRRVSTAAGYFVDFEIEKADTEPPPRKFSDFVERELANLPDHAELAASLPKGVGRDDLPQAVYNRDGVRINVTFIPMKKEAPTKADPDGRIVGMGPIIGGIVNAAGRLKERVSAKAGGRYEIADVPFVVAVGVHDTVCSEDQIIDALYGHEAVVIQTGGLTRQNDGVFGVDREKPEGRHRRISSVAVIDGLRVWEADDADVALYDNPYANHDAIFILPIKRHLQVVEGDDSRKRLEWQ